MPEDMNLIRKAALIGFLLQSGRRSKLVSKFRMTTGCDMSASCVLPRLSEKKNGYAIVPHHLARHPHLARKFSSICNFWYVGIPQSARPARAVPSRHLAGLSCPAVKTTPSLCVPHPPFTAENRVVMTKLAV
jgi:hypothetical protein